MISNNKLVGINMNGELVGMNMDNILVGINRDNILVVNCLLEIFQNIFLYIINSKKIV